MAPLVRASILIAALAVTGCSAAVVDEVADANAGMTEGVVLVERIASGEGTQSYVSAKFMRLPSAAEPATAERVVGVKLDLPSIGACASFAPTSQVDKKAASLGTIELMDVGDVSLRIQVKPTGLRGGSFAIGSGAGSMARDLEPMLMPLAARAFPDVGDLVSGVVYTSRDAASTIPAGATYVVEGTGSVAVDRFSVEAAAPSAPEDVRVGDATLTEGVALDEGAPITVRWSVPAEARAGQMGKAGNDVVVVELSAASGASVRCAFKDEGEGVVPVEAIRGHGVGGASSSATLAVHRIRERAFNASGIDVGEVRFDLSTLGRVTFAPRTL